MDNLINEYIKTEFIEEKNTYFGYFENFENIIFIFVKDSEIKTVDKISKIIVNFLATELMKFEKYDIDVLEQSVKNVKQYLKNNNYDNTLSLCVMITDLCKIKAIVLGDICLKLIRNDKAEIETKLNSACLGGNSDNIKANIISDITLKENDLIKFCDENDEKITITVLKTLQKQAVNSKKMVYNKFLIIVIFFLFFIIYGFFNHYTINKYDKKINRINNDLKIYLKNLEVQNIEIEYSNLENIYSLIESKKFLIIPKQKEIEYRKNKERIKIIKEDVDKIKNIYKNLKLAKECINKESFDIAKDLYNKTLEYSTKIINIENLKKEILLNITMIDELEKINEFEKEADELFNNFKIKKAKDLYEKILKICKKYNKTTNINTKIVQCDEKITNLNEKINLLLIESEHQSVKDAVKTRNAYLELLKSYEAIDDVENIKKINEKINLLETNNNMEKNRALSLREEAYSYAEQKNYKNSIECMYESNKIFKKLRLEKELGINNIHIRKMKNSMKTEFKYIKENINRKDIKISDKKNQILRSINLSIKKGDSYVKNDKYKDAIIEYQRALNFCESLGYTGEKVEKLKKKLAYSIKKNSNVSWWKNIWK